MRYLLVTLEYPPFHGGIAHYYSHLAAAWPRNDEFIVLIIITISSRRLAVFGRGGDLSKLFGKLLNSNGLIMF